jgi:hypothetical protein
MNKTEIKAQLTELFESGSMLITDYNGFEQFLIEVVSQLLSQLPKEEITDEHPALKMIKDKLASGEYVQTEGKNEKGETIFLVNKAVSEPIRQLSEITDQDAIEVAKICDIHQEDGKIENGMIAAGKTIANELKEGGTNRYGLTITDVVKAYQYLQSRNYQLPVYYTEKGGKNEPS